MSLIQITRDIIMHTPTIMKDLILTIAHRIRATEITTRLDIEKVVTMIINRCLVEFHIG